MSFFHDSLPLSFPCLFVLSIHSFHPCNPFQRVVRKPMKSAPIPRPSNTPAFSHNIEYDTQESDISFLSSQRQSMLSVKSLNKVFREATESTSIEFVYDLIALLT